MVNEVFVVQGLDQAKAAVRRIEWSTYLTAGKMQHCFTYVYVYFLVQVLRCS